MDLAQDLLLYTQHGADSKLASPAVVQFPRQPHPGYAGVGRFEHNTAMFYGHVLKRGPMGVISPADLL
jgi:hypothetical protein